MFSFDRAGMPPGPPPENVLEILSRAAERAGSMGIQLAIENEDGFWGDTGGRTASLVRAVGHPALGVNWDPGNAYCAGRAVPGWLPCRPRSGPSCAFQRCAPQRGGTAEYVAKGEIDWAGQMRALAADGYDGFISVETHLRPKVGSRS